MGDWYNLIIYHCGAHPLRGKAITLDLPQGDRRTVWGVERGEIGGRVIANGSAKNDGVSIPGYEEVRSDAYTLATRQIENGEPFPLTVRVARKKACA